MDVKDGQKVLKSVVDEDGTQPGLYRGGYWRNPSVSRSAIAFPMASGMEAPLCTFNQEMNS